MLLAQKAIKVECLAVEQLRVVQIKSLSMYVIALYLMDFLFELLFKNNVTNGMKQRYLFRTCYFCSA